MSTSARKIRPLRPVLASLEARFVLSTAAEMAVIDPGDQKPAEYTTSAFDETGGSTVSYGQGDSPQTSSGSSGSSSGETSELVGYYTGDHSTVYEHGDPFPGHATFSDLNYAEYYGTDSGSGSSSGGGSTSANADYVAQREADIKAYNDDVRAYNTDKREYNGRVTTYNKDRAALYSKIAAFEKEYGSKLALEVTPTYDPIKQTTTLSLQIKFNTSISSAARAEKEAIRILGEDLVGQNNLLDEDQFKLSQRAQALGQRYNYLVYNYTQIRQVAP